MEPSPALQLARRIRYEQGTEQLRRYLSAIEPFIAPAERAAIAKQMGIQIVKAQSSSPKEAQSQPVIRQEEPDDPHESYQPRQQGPANSQQMQMLQMLAQLAGGGMPGLGNLGGAMNSNGGLNPMLLAQLLSNFNKK
jgi:hypothetical protein